MLFESQTFFTGIFVSSACQELEVMVTGKKAADHSPSCVIPCTAAAQQPISTPQQHSSTAAQQHSITAPAAQHHSQLTDSVLRSQ
jgi:hypothetical protein